MSSTLSLSFFKCTKVLINIFYFDEQYFCETPAEIALCPEGEFCKVGNVAGIPCGSKRDCPKGSSHSGNTGVVIAAVIIFLVLFLIFSIKYFIEAKVREAQRGALSKEKDDISEEATRRMTLSSTLFSCPPVKGLHTFTRGREINQKNRPTPLLRPLF